MIIYRGPPMKLVYVLMMTNAYVNTLHQYSYVCDALFSCVRVYIISKADELEDRHTYAHTHHTILHIHAFYTPPTFIHTH